MSVRILHTSDVHLGATFRVLGTRGREHRKQLQHTFVNICSLAIHERVDVVLIAGDLFDSVAAARAEAEFVDAQFGRLGAADIPICAIAGIQVSRRFESAAGSENWTTVSGFEIRRPCT